MELINLTEDEIELALSNGGVADVWFSFFRFLAWEITRYERSINIPPEGDHLWEAWYLGFIRRSIVAYAPLGPFPHHQGPDTPSVWLNAASNVAEWSRNFVSIIAGIVREKQAAIAKQQAATEKPPSDTDPPGYDSNIAPSSSPLEEEPLRIAGVQNPRPPIRFAVQQHLGAHITYLYFHSPPSLQSFLQDLRKRHELRASDKIVSLLVMTSTRHVPIRIMVGEEQEEWDWDSVMEEISGDEYRATIVFEVKPE